MKKFPIEAGKILPGLLLLAMSSGCQFSTTASAEASSTRVPVVAPAGTVLRVRLNQALDTERSRPGDRFSGVLDSPVVAEGKEILPKGTAVDGHVVSAQASGRLDGRAVLALTLDSCQRNGQTVALETSTVTRLNGRHAKRNWPMIGSGSGAGAATSGPAAEPAGSLIGAGTGAGIGTTGTAFTGKKLIALLVETVIGFTLKSPLAE